MQLLLLGHITTKKIKPVKMQKQLLNLMQPDVWIVSSILVFLNNGESDSHDLATFPLNAFPPNGKAYSIPRFPYSLLSSYHIIHVQWAQWWHPKIYVHVLIPENCDYYLTQQNNKYYLIWNKYIIKLKILRGHDYPGLSRYNLNAVTKVLIKERQEISQTCRREDIMMIVSC